LGHDGGSSGKRKTCGEKKNLNNEKGGGRRSATNDRTKGARRKNSVGETLGDLGCVKKRGRSGSRRQKKNLLNTPPKWKDLRNLKGGSGKNVTSSKVGRGKYRKKPERWEKR